MGRRYITPKGQHIPGGYDHEPRGIVGTPAHTDDLSRDTSRASVRYGSNPDNAVSIYDPTIGRLRTITPDELALLRRKAAAWDEIIHRALATINSANRDGAYLRCELNDIAVSLGDGELSPYSVNRNRRESRDE